MRLHRRSTPHGSGPRGPHVHFIRSPLTDQLGREVLREGGRGRENEGGREERKRERRKEKEKRGKWEGEGRKREGEKRGKGERREGKGEGEGRKREGGRRLRQGGKEREGREKGKGERGREEEGCGRGVCPLISPLISQYSYRSHPPPPYVKINNVKVVTFLAMCLALSPCCCICRRVIYLVSQSPCHNTNLSKKVVGNWNGSPRAGKNSFVPCSAAAWSGSG